MWDTGESNPDHFEKTVIHLPIMKNYLFLPHRQRGFGVSLFKKPRLSSRITEHYVKQTNSKKHYVITLSCGCPIRTATPAIETGMLPLHHTRGKMPLRLTALRHQHT